MSSDQLLPFYQVTTKICLKILFLTEFSAGLLTNASDKCNLVMALAADLIFFTDQPRMGATDRDMPFYRTSATPMLASWFYQSLPLFFLIFRIGDNLPSCKWQFAECCIMPSWMAVTAEVVLALLFCLNCSVNCQSIS